MNASSLAPADFADSNLLFAVLALQRGFLDQNKFVDACAAWAARRDTPLPDLLVDRHWLTAGDKSQIDQDLQRLLQEHQGDIRASIREVADDQAVRQSLAHVFADSELKNLEGSASMLTEHKNAGQTRERYVLLGQPKIGGIGQVWRAKDVRLGREVALKELRQDRVLSGELRERFLAEAQVTAQLTHPNIVPAFELVPASGAEPPFYTMQYVEGRTLTDAAREFHGLRKGGKAGALELRELLTAFVALCKAVEYAHERGVLHRDLKGLNVILGDHGEVYLLDWGLAKVMGQAEPRTQATPVDLATMDPGSETRQGALVGTPPYMAPEQAAGRIDQIDPRTDVYALGVILYEILTGRLPFVVADTPSLFDGLPTKPADRIGELNRRKIARLLDLVQKEPPPSPHSIQDQVPLPLEKVCLKALAKKKDDRYQAAKELAREIERWLADEPVDAWPEPWTVKGWRWFGKHRTLVTGAAVALLVGLVISVLFGGLLTAAYNELAEKSEELVNANVKLEDTVKKLNASLDKGKSLLARNYFQRSWVEHEKGSFADSLHWMLLAYQEAPTKDPFRWSYRHCLGAQAHATRFTVVHGSRVAFSPDGKTVLTRSDDTVRLWDAATGRPQGDPMCHQLGFQWRGVLGATFSPDGKTVLTGGEDGTARFWDAATGKPRSHTLRHEILSETAIMVSVLSIVFSPDGHRVLTGTSDGTAWLWDVETGTTLGQPLRHDDRVKVLAFSPDGKKVLTGSGDSARLWNPAKGIQVGATMRHESYVMALTFSPDGKSALTGSLDGTARLWDAATGKQLGPALRHGPRDLGEVGVEAVCFSPDGKRVVTASNDKTARLWDASTGQGLGEIMRHGDAVVAVAFSPDGKSVVTGSRDGTMRLWDGHTGKQLGEPLRHSAPLLFVKFSPDGKSVLTGSSDNTARLWDAEPGKPLGKPLRHDDSVTRVEFDSDCKSILTYCSTGVLYWDAATGKRRGEPISYPPNVGPVDVSPDGKTLVMAYPNRTALLWDLTTDTQLGNPLKHSGSVKAVTFSPDSKRVLTGSSGGTAHLWEVSTGKPLCKPLQHRNDSDLHSVHAVAFSPNGNTVLTGSTDGTAQLWDAATGKSLGQPLLHEGEVAAVCLSPDGKTALTGSLGKTARLWDVATGKQIGEPLHHEKAVTSVAFSPDGKSVLTGCWDNKARLWDAATGVQLTQPLCHEGFVWSVAFSPDGKSALTGSNDGTARLWQTVPLPPDDMPRLRAWVRVITGKTFNENGVLRCLSYPEWLRCREELDALGGDWRFK